MGRENKDEQGKSKHRKKRKRESEKTPVATLRSATSSPFYSQSYSLYVALSPIAQASAVKGLCAEHLSPLILTYYPPFSGIVLSYANPRCSTDRPRLDASCTDGRQKAYARSVNEYGATFVWLTADFIIFKPERGDNVEGVVNLQNATTLNLLCWNFFSASIRGEQLPKDWRWVSGRDVHGAGEMSSKSADADGHFLDHQGNKVEGKLTFSVLHVETPSSLSSQGGIVSIRGSLIHDRK